MSNLKPLIFVHPLQETLKELHKIMVETAENDGTEVYDIDSITEFNQLFAAVGQSVCIFGNPKKCAQALQANKKVNSKLHSKILLLTQKPIPRKTLEKFEKIGLTECINEPVAPKTLLYKVRLQLKSIASIAEQEEMNRKFGSEEDKSDVGKELKEKSLEKEASHTSDNQPEKKKAANSTDEDLYKTEKKKSEYEEEKIDSHMKGKVSSSEDALDYGKKEKNTYKEESLDQYYKGKSKGSLSLDEDQDQRNTNPGIEMDVSELKDALSLELEEELLKEENAKIKKFEEEVEQKKKEQKRLALEEEREKNKKKATKVDQLDSHMRGRVGSENTEEEIDDAINSTQMGITVEEESEDDPVKLQIDEEELLARSNRAKLDIESDQEKKREASNNEPIDGHLTGDGKRTKLDTDEKQMNEADVEHIETHYKGHFDHQKNQDEKSTNERSKLDIAEETLNKTERTQNQIDEQENGARAEKSHLDISADGSEKKMNSANDEGNQDEQNRQKSKSPLELESADINGTSSNTDTKTEEELDSAGTTNNKNAIDKSDKNQPGKGEEEKSSHSLMGSSTADKQEKKNGLADARADQIQKHYKGKGNSHQEQGWGNLHQKSSGTQESFEKPKLSPSLSTTEDEQPSSEELNSYEVLAKKNKTIEYEGSEQNRKKNAEYEFENGSKYSTEYELNEKKKGPATSYELAEDSPNSDALPFSHEKVSIGDQIIDYNKLKKEFEAMGLDPENQLIKSFIYQDEGDIEDIVEPEELSNIENEIFEAMPCGLDIIITVQELYQKQDPNKIFDYIARKLLERYKAKMSVYKNDESDFTEIYSIYHHSEISSAEMKEWHLLKSVKLPFWKLMTLPTLGDHTFVENENEFVYPIFEGKKHLAYLILSWDKTLEFSLDDNLIHEIEAILESTRGLFLVEQMKTKAQTGNKEKEEKGLFGRFFGKRAS